MLYPLGEDVFALVKKGKKNSIKIHIRHYVNQGGRGVVPTQRGVSMTLKGFQQLLKVQKKLKNDYHQLTTEACSSGSQTSQSRRRKKQSSASYVPDQCGAVDFSPVILDTLQQTPCFGSSYPPFLKEEQTATDFEHSQFK